MASVESVQFLIVTAPTQRSTESSIEIGHRFNERVPVFHSSNYRYVLAGVIDNGIPDVRLRNFTHAWYRMSQDCECAAVNSKDRVITQLPVASFLR
jgi:hypothetical protein